MRMEAVKEGSESFIVRCIGAVNSSHIDATFLGLTHASLHPCNNLSDPSCAASVNTVTAAAATAVDTSFDPVTSPQQSIMKSAAAAAAAAMLMLALLCGESRCMLAWN